VRKISVSRVREARGTTPGARSAAPARPGPARGYNDAVSGGARTAQTHECRQCCTYCDRVVHPAGCIESSCPYLYLYDDEATGSRYMGCLGNVFRVEIDVELFQAAERTRHGFGAVKMAGRPTPRCRISVERAYEGAGEAFECVNPGFFEQPEMRPDPAEALDLRDRL
jgi:hypothetical protein